MRGYEGSNGPLTPGAEERLTYADTNEDGVSFAASNPTWAADGRGILYSFSPRPYSPGEKKLGVSCVANHPCHPVAMDFDDTCLALLPPTGGSAYWNVCESRTSHSSATDLVPWADLSPSGALLYIEQSRPAPPPPLTPFPPAKTGTYADLWLATPERPLDRRELCRLYALDTLTRLAPATACPFTVMSDLRWLGTSTFAVLAGGTLQVGAITSQGVTFTPVPNSPSIGHYALVDGNRAVVFVTASPSVRRLALADGTVTVVATLPLGPGGQVLDIGCHPDVCIVLASTGGASGTWNLWKVDLATGSAAIVRTFTHAISAAKLSPVSGDVLAQEGANLYLLTGVVP